MTFENTPRPDIDATLTLEEAAKKAGYTANSFRTTMSKLNTTGNDLRAPARPGERARRYDLDKLNAWIAAGKPSPQDATPTESAHTIHATAKHVKGTWTTTLETGEPTVGKTLRALQTNAAALAAQRMDVPAHQISVHLDVETPHEAEERWAEAARKVKEGQKLIAQAMDERRAVVAELRASGGFIQDDIAAMLGISQQRVVQFLQGNTKS